MFHKEGRTIILSAFVIVVALLILADRFVPIMELRIGLQIVLIVFLVLILQFFRNPKRPVRPSFDEILAPVDGKVVVVEEVEEAEYFKEKRRQISIFMSPLNVHVTRYPASGAITFSKYHPGKYLVAWHPKSSTDNERTTVVLRTPKFGEILYRQIAGAMARRIVNYAETGERAIQGEDAGFIKFGSRVDLFLPLDAQICVKIGQKVKGAKTCVAMLADQDDR
ncbi:MAG: phosphatidylserine decarboxylase family protein [Bacteroidota bacterium]